MELVLNIRFSIYCFKTQVSNVFHIQRIAKILAYAESLSMATIYGYLCGQVASRELSMC